jgi:hypothetical protein
MIFDVIVVAILALTLVGMLIPVITGVEPKRRD